MKPWHDVPRCDCGGPMVTTDLRRLGRLRCCACGKHVHGDDSQVRQAEVADAAWEAERASWAV